ncbi:MAG: HAD hydrolase-like protein [Lachnospiraceae bacterium]|nr:HAD hydrolase-like protein [Lachnospiraceae bacterium]
MNNGKYDAAIFDADGTLFYTKPGIVECIKDVVKSFGLRNLNDDEYDQFIGPPIQLTFAKVFGLSPEEGDRAAKEFRRLYVEDRYLFDGWLYEGMEETLKTLKDNGIKVGVATYKMEPMAKKICHHFRVDDYADSIHGTDDNSTIKKPEIIRMVMRDYGCEDPSRVVMIGDTGYDAAGAEGAGCRFLGVTFGFGFGTREDVMQYPFSIGEAASPKDILNYFI